ncbi:hypothetical protein QFZ64_000877 [Streptomyces sp. B3I8]|nr:hypothetical protein [Streptomyces sp. B3I8]
MTRQIAAVTGAWRDGQVVDIPAEMEKITARVLLATMFSTSVSPQAMARVSDDLRVVVTGIFRRMFLPAALDRLPTAATSGRVAAFGAPSPLRSPTASPPRAGTTAAVRIFCPS